MIDEDVEYTFHCYDHCPFGNRVAFLMDHFGIKYKKVVYGYGSGALPNDCEGEGYDGELNPRNLTGKKQLPVLEGPDVPCASDAVGMAESLEICSFLIARHELVVPCATGRSDVQALIDYLLDKKHKKKGDLLEFATKEEDDAAIAALNAKLAEIPSLMKGDGCLNKWGWGMDDVLLLAWLRRLTCIKGVVFPEPVATYMAGVGKQVVDYGQHAV